MNPGKKNFFLPVLSIILSAAGLAAFIYLFILDFNFYWLFLSPVILALYQIPAAFVFWLHKRRRAAAARAGESEGQGQGPGQP